MPVMPLSAIKRYLLLDARYIKLMCWAIYIIELAAYWRFQHQMVVDTFAPYGVSNLTMGCLMVVLALLPYSLSHKLKLEIHWYALCFLPSVVILTFIANERISLSDILSAAVMSAVFVWLIVNRKGLLPRITNGICRCRAINSNLWIIILMIIYSIVFANTNEVAHYCHTIRHYLDTEQWNKALTVGKRSLHTDSTLFCLRAEAMVKNGKLGETLFCYPIPPSGCTIKIHAPLSAKQSGDVLLCNMLLNKDLNSFVDALPQWYDIHSPQLPKHYKEALVVFLSQSVSTALNYSDTMTEANYADFLAEKKKYKNKIESNNMCRYLYGDTYFWYYFFFNSNANHDK